MRDDSWWRGLWIYLSTPRWAASAYVLGGSETVFRISSSLASIFVFVFNDHSLRYSSGLFYGSFDDFYDCIDLSMIDFV